MHIKSNLKHIWLAVGAFSMILLAFDWFGFGSHNLQNTILGLNVLMFVLSLPCSIFVVPVIAAASYYLEIHTTSGVGIYVNTIFLFVLGFMQWFWIANFWSPAEKPFQMLDLLGENSR